jgi:hypothetical protein
MRKWLKKWLERIGIVSGIWAVIRAIWAVIGHYGNFQTLWGIVKDWPAYLQYGALVVGSVWLPLGIALLSLVGWMILKTKDRRDRNYAAVTFEDAIIVPSGQGDGIQRLIHHPISDVTAKLLPEKQGAPVLVEIINKSNSVARLHTARLLGIDGNGNEELLLGPNYIVAIHEWKRLPFVMEPKSRVSIAFAGMNLERLPKKFVAYLVEVELEDDTKIRTDKRIKSPDNTDQNVKQWIEARFPRRVVLMDDRYHFMFEVQVPQRVTIRRIKTRPEYITLLNKIGTTDEQRTKLKSMSDQDRESFFQAINLESSRYKIEPHFVQDFRYACLHYNILITSELTESRLMDGINDMKFAHSVIHHTINNLLKPPSQVPNTEVSPPEPT